MRTETLFRLLGVDLVSPLERIPSGYCPARNFGLGHDCMAQWGSFVTSFSDYIVIDVKIHAEAANRIEFARAEAEDGTPIKVYLLPDNTLEFRIDKMPSNTVVHWAALTI